VGIGISPYAPFFLFVPLYYNLSIMKEGTAYDMYDISVIRFNQNHVKKRRA
jgi:hypothetical protein